MQETLSAGICRCQAEGGREGRDARDQRDAWEISEWSAPTPPAPPARLAPLARPAFRASFQNRYDFGLHRLAVDEGLAVADVNVQLTADAELPGEIDAGLDGEAGAGQQSALVPGLQIINVRAVAMHFFADGMAGPVDEPLGVAGLPNDLPADVVHFPPAGKIPRLHPCPDESQRRVSRPAHDGEDIPLSPGDRLADVAGPGDVRVHAARLRALRPEVYQHQVAGHDLRRPLWPRPVMRVRAVGVGRRDRWGGRDQAVGLHAREDGLLEIVLGE